ncbi:MAG TPA: PAS domain S-box protein [Vicinamibacterales bacterium]|nr:PAS domain S-box protein [Vicinamibacterales bacterium]
MATHDLPDGQSARDPAAEAPPVPSAGDETLLAQLFDLSPFPAVVSRLADGTVLAVNARTSEMFGVSPSEALGLRVSDYYVDPSQREQLVAQLRREGRVDNVRIHTRRPNGEPFWALASSRLVTYRGEPAILAVFNDISEQVLAEQALQASERRLAAQSNALTALTSRSADATDRFDDRLRGILEVSARTLKVDRLSMWRFDDERLAIRCVGLHRCSACSYESGAELQRHVAPAYFDALERERVIAAHDAARDPRTREFRDSYLKPNGIGAMLDVPLRNRNTAVGVLCAEHVGGIRSWTVDEQNFAISTANLIAVAVADEDLRAALARVAESEARARLVVDTAHDAFVGIDAAGRIVSWNTQAERTFGWTYDEAIGRGLTDTIIPPSFREAHIRGLKRFLDTGEAPVVNQRLELTALNRAGREFPVEITITSPIRVEEGYFFGAFLRDISDRREHEDQLRLAKESAEAATRAKSEFLANMSHELRTPLNGVLGYTQLLQRDRNLNPTQRDALDAIAKCGSHLLDLINDILDLSKIEAGVVDMEVAATDLAQLSIDLKYVVGETARRKGLLLTMSIADDVPRRVVLDGRHLRQVLLNLLGNAVKFTDTGEVRLGIERVGDDRLSFEVSDTGIGIEEDALTAIFEAFTQTKAGAAAGGTGLGLAISNHLIRKMGDQLKVESEPGRGSRFYFSLPLVAGSDSSWMRSDAELASLLLDARLMAGQDVTALVADDSSVNRRILASLLESAGVRVITAAGGVEALQLTREHRPDVVFMDLKMGDLDGLEATRRLRADPATAQIPVIAVTASAFGDTRAAAMAAGCVDYLAKPVRAELLFSVLQNQLGVRFEQVVDQTKPAVETPLTDVPRRREVAARLVDAITIGDVSGLEGLAQELVAGDESEAMLGHRIARLVADFDFDGLRDLAESLSGGEETRAVE